MALMTTFDGDAEQAGVDQAEMDEELRLYAEFVAALEREKAKPPSPSVLHQHLAEIQGRARALAEREAIEEHDNSLERWAERWARRSTDPRFVLPDRPSGDPLVRDRNAL